MPRQPLLINGISKSYDIKCTNIKGLTMDIAEIQPDTLLNLRN